MINQFSKLIVKDLFGALSDDEKSRLAELRSELKIDEGMYLQMKQRIADPELHTKLQQQPLRTIKRPLWRVALRYAALLLVPLCVAAYFALQGPGGFWGSKSTTEIGPQEELARLVPERKQPQLMLSDGSVVNLTAAAKEHIISQHIVRTEGTLSYLKHPAAELLPATSPAQIPAPAREPAYNTLSIPEGGDYKVILSDGTTVYLNEKSVLRYPVEFTGRMREVSLIQGEMYFEVAKDATHPFVVHTAGGDIRVLGTSFNVRSSEQVVATLVEGSVEICNDNYCVTLKPNQQAAFNNHSGPITIETVHDMEELICWKDNIFYFNDKTLEQILDKVAAWYGFDVRYEDSQLKERRYYIYIDKYSDLKTILNTLASVSNPRFRVEGTTIIVD